MIMDIEGHEIIALEGMRELLQTHSIRDLIIEVHPDMIKDNGRDDKEILRILQAAQYCVEILTVEGRDITYHIHASRPY